jgi:hypothetical protein
VYDLDSADIFSKERFSLLPARDTQRQTIQMILHEIDVY